MKMRVALSVFAVLLVVSMATGTSRADDDATSAPLGLEWGMSRETVKSLGVSLEPVDDDGDGKADEARNLPKILRDAASVRLSFGFDDRLWRIFVISKSFSDDPYGSKVRARYDALSGLLSQKYGPRDRRHSIEDGPYSKPRHFLFALNSGHGTHFTMYATTPMFVYLAIEPVDTSTGAYVLLFQRKDLAAAVDAIRKEREKDAL